MSTQAEKVAIRVAVARLKKAVAIAEVIRRHAADAGADPVASAGLITTDEARDVVAQLAGCRLNPDTGHYTSPITWALAVAWLELAADLDSPACRFVGDGHHCARRDGRALQAGEECFAEQRADLFDTAEPSDFDAAVQA